MEKFYLNGVHFRIRIIYYVAMYNIFFQYHEQYIPLNYLSFFEIL